MFNVLVDAAGTVTCQSVIRGLRAAEGFVNKIITIDCDPINAGRFMSDRFYRCPKANTPEYIDFLNELIEEEDINIVIPIIDSGLLNISANIDKLSKKAIVVISGYDTIVKCDNKKLTHDLFNETGVNTPNIYSSIASIPSNSFPVFVKPLTGGRASIGCQKIESYDEAYIAVRKTVDELLFMDYVEGTEYTIDCISDLEGNFIGALPRIRMETKSGVSYKSEIVNNSALVWMVREICKTAKIKGPCNIQCIEDKDGNFWFIEINPRFSGTLAASISAGFNSVEVLLRIISGKTIPNELLQYKEGFFIRFWDDVFVSKGLI